MEKVQCMSLSSIYIHYNHEALRAAGGCFESGSDGFRIGSSATREPMTQYTCLLIVSSVGVKLGYLGGLVVICES